MTNLSNLLKLIQLSPLSKTQFTGFSQDIGTGMVYGGQVLGQAVYAAQNTVPDERKIHSAHAYFLRPGDLDQAITYSVDNTRDGKSYSSRTVTASQNGTIIFTMMCSFQKEEASEFDFCNAIDTSDFFKKCSAGINMEQDPTIKRHLKSQLLNSLPLMLRLPEESNESYDDNEYFCVKANDTMPEQTLLHQATLAYLSDFRILASSLRLAGYRYQLDKIMLSTICHGIWFHREFKVDDWLFGVFEPLSLSNGRGISRGSFYNSDGLLVASTVQEGVVRKRRSP